MSKVNWEFFLSRNRLTINDFLSSALTLQDALACFDTRGLTHPEVSVIELVVAENNEERERKAKELLLKEQKANLPKPTTSRRSKSKVEPKSTQKTEPKSSTSKTRRTAKSEVEDEKEAQRYFRKVVPTKKSKK